MLLNCRVPFGDPVIPDYSVPSSRNFPRLVIVGERDRLRRKKHTGSGRQGGAWLKSSSFVDSLVARKPQLVKQFERKIINNPCKQSGDAFLATTTWRPPARPEACDG